MKKTIYVYNQENSTAHSLVKKLSAYHLPGEAVPLTPGEMGCLIDQEEFNVFTSEVVVEEKNEK